MLFEYITISKAMLMQLAVASRGDRLKGDELKAIIDATVFKNLIGNAKAFLRNDYINKMMSYILLEVNAEAKEIKATALDGYRVSIETIPIKEADESFKCFIRPNLPKITKNDRFVELELKDNKCFVTVSENIVGFIQPEGKFWDVNKIVTDTEGKDVAASVLVDASLLKEALNSVKIEGNIKNYVKIEVRDKQTPIVIRYGKGKNRNNLKLVLPVSGD